MQRQNDIITEVYMLVIKGQLLKFNNSGELLLWGLEKKLNFHIHIFCICLIFHKSSAMLVVGVVVTQLCLTL